MSARHAWLSHRRFAYAGIAGCIFALLTSPVLAQGSLSLPACTNTTQSFSLDLSTTSNQAAVTDPNWTVSAVTPPALSVPKPYAPATANNPAYHLTQAAVTNMQSPNPAPWAILPNWIQPSANPLPNDSATAGYYTYQISFFIPCAKADLSLTGTYYADNWVSTFLANGISVNATCTNRTCLSIGTNFSVPANDLQQGLNTLTIIVQNATASAGTKNWTGLAVDATLSETCNSMCAGVLKICKIAGPGVTPGTASSFAYSSANGAGTLTVPAGPAPGGYCALGPSLSMGTNVTVTEDIPTGSPNYVGGISINGYTGLQPYPGSTVSGDSVTFPTGSGVNEVTYTDEAPTGYLEICKLQVPQPNGTNIPALGNSIFTVSPENSAPIVVPAGACSPAIQVPATIVTITEAQTPGASMTSCTTIPASQQRACAPGARISKVLVAPGGTSTQTIANITNMATPINPNGGGGGNGNGNNNNNNNKN